MDLSKPVLFSFDYPPMGGGISRLCSEIVGQASLHQGVQFNVLSCAHQKRPWREIAALFHLLKEPAAPYCICGLWYPEGLLATLAQVRGRVILAHGSELMPPRQKWRRKIWAKLQNWILSRAELVVANSQYTAEMVKASAPQASVMAIPLAVDADYFTPGPKARARQNLQLPNDLFIISSVARVHRYKGYETVFRALMQLSPEERKKILYVIAGSGPDRQNLEAQAAEMGISDHILWFGFVEEKDLPDFYRASDLFVLCTKESSGTREVEGFGLVFLEAQACGTPVIGSRCGGIPDAISEGDGGWLITPENSQELAKKISHCMKDPGLLSSQGEKARARVLHSCTWRKYIHRLFEELKSQGVLGGS